ncbi:MAG: hypothetical protein WAT79_01550 [Saprospiraceae bacterium]
MSNEYFQELSDAEYGKLKDAIALITVLIAGADGTIQKNELDWAAKVTKIRSYNMSEDLKEFYKEVGIQYADQLNEFFDSFPSTVEDRTRLISERISQLDPILAKLHPKVGARLYKSYLSFAKHVAKASGGFLGFFSINKQEAKLIGLPMLTPIFFKSDEEEE